VLVTKEALLDALWPEANVTDNALAQAVSELRQALGDVAGSPQFIKTVARRGYRFIGHVSSVDPPPTDVAALSGETAAPAIAVMDFSNVTGDGDAAWLSAGIAETVTGDLRALGHFRVVDRRRLAEAVRGTDGSLQQIAHALGARFAVVGSFQQHGAHVRISARVLDVVSGEALADAKVDGPLDRIFDLQDEVVAQFSRELGIPVAQARPPAARGRDTASLEAYRAFTEGSVRLESLDVREMPQSVADFERAVAADPRYAAAYTGLASAELALYESTRSDSEPARDRLEHAIGHARRAVQLDDTLAEAHATLALVLVSARSFLEATAAARRAVALEPANWRHLFRLGHASWGELRLRAAEHTLTLHPDFAFAHFQMAMVHVARGAAALAETVLRQGAAVQDRQIGRGGRLPALGLHWLLGLVRLAQDDVDEALDEFERETVLAEPHRLYGREYTMHAFCGRGAALLRAGRPSDAIDAFRQALQLYPQHPSAHLGLALALRATGSAAAADGSLARAHEALPALTRARPLAAAIARAELFAAASDPDRAVAVLDELLDAPAGFVGWTLPVEPFLRQLHDTRPFAAVLERLAERAR
jgi:TolB-like protein/Flp pilus assembly protein TadD